MDRDDGRDLREHPEWFVTEPLYGTSPALLTTLPIMSAEQRARVMEEMANPPVVIRRRPIPFVLPIRGSAL